MFEGLVPKGTSKKLGPMVCKVLAGLIGTSEFKELTSAGYLTLAQGLDMLAVEMSAEMGLFGAALAGQVEQYAAELRKIVRGAED